MLVEMGSVLRPAAALGTALGAFNVFSLEHAEALVSGAEAVGRPVVLQISQNAVRYHGALAPILTATLALARAADVQAVVHLDHASDVELIHRAVELGCGSVMYDGSALPYEQNVARTAEVAGYATTTACTWRPSWVRWAARTACTPRTPGPTRPRPRRSSRPPASTRWPSRSGPRTP